MTILRVPYHLDEFLPDFPSLDFPAGGVVTLTETLPEADVWARMGHLHEAVARRVAESVRGGVTPMVLSGDCMVSLGTVAGVGRAGLDPAIVWFDAHGDLQTLETSTSGYVGGVPLRILVGYRPELSAERLGLRAVPEERVLLVDARDLDPPEVDYLRTARTRRCDVEEVTADALPPGPLVLHVDLDVIDPEGLPGLLFPTPGGPAASAVVDAALRVLDTGRVAAVSLGCTWDPSQEDPQGARSRVLTALAAALPR